MAVVGVDAHKRTHTLVAVDELGRRLGEKTVPATSDGHFQVVEWVARWLQVRFAVEDCRHLTRRLEGDLLRAGYRVARVPTPLMAAARRSGRRPGKSDPIDAEAVALAALRHPDLPAAHLDGPTRQVKLICDYRRDLVRERTKLVNRLRWHLHELDPELQVPSRGLRRYRVIDDLTSRLAGAEGSGGPYRPRPAGALPGVDGADQRAGEGAKQPCPPAGTEPASHSRLRRVGRAR